MAPNITPWSVSARLVMPCAAAAAISGSTRARPSSSEYSVWQCRWVYSGAAIDLMLPEARGLGAVLVNDSTLQLLHLGRLQRHVGRSRLLGPPPHRRWGHQHAGTVGRCATSDTGEI